MYQEKAERAEQWHIECTLRLRTDFSDKTTVVEDRLNAGSESTGRVDWRVELKSAVIALWRRRQSVSGTVVRNLCPAEAAQNGVKELPRVRAGYGATSRFACDLVDKSTAD